MQRLITLKINDIEHVVEAEPKNTLLDVLRDKLFLTGAKKGCERGECGACSVLVDGKVMNSCSLLAIDMQGRNITTIEGLSDGENLHPIQQSFIDQGAVQCGYCTPGMILTAKSLINENPCPTDLEIRQAFAGNACRCTGYTKIIEAVKVAAKTMERRRQMGS